MTLREDIEELKRMANKGEDVKPEKEKKFKYPFGKKIGKGQKKKNYITVLKINENMQCEFLKRQIDDQTFTEDGIPRLAAAGYVLQDRGNPFVILPSWSVEPFSPLTHYNESLINGNNTAGYKLLMAKMQRGLVENKKQMGGILKWILGLGLVALIVYAFISSGGGT